ncbi:hypothetical protein [Lacticaseibacillus salsurivasis]|uniref:hypothetical protein n=1 Tax=Lacticaseibacillus salsurivasis TaxID=3081441 RepID=UPI0030C67901
MKNVYRLILTLLGLVGVAGLAGCGTTASQPKPEPDTAPSYNAAKTRVLFSDKVNQLNDTQNASFWKLAHRALAAGDPSADASKFKGIGLRVEKQMPKHQYLLIYQVKATKPFPVKATYSMVLTLHSKNLNQGKVKFDLLDYELLSIDSAEASSKGATD